MSHELRTPLNGILGTIDSAHDADLDFADFLKTLKSSTDRLRTLVDQILTFVSLQDGVIQVDQDPFSLLEIEEGIRARHLPRAESKGVRLHIDAPSKDARCLGDVRRIAQVLDALVDNAIKYQSGPGTIHVRLQLVSEGPETRTNISFEIEDGGPGIDPNRWEELCQPFAQGDSGDRRGFEGAGLGLAVVTGLARCLGAQVRLLSGRGEGALIRVTIPLEHAPVERVAENHQKGLHILIAEDNPTNQKIASRFVQKIGFSSQVANDGASAFELWESDPEAWDMVLMDIQMPILDGIEAARRIRAAEGDREPIPIIALTADGREDTRQRAREVGMDAYLTKPFSRTELERVVTKCLASRIENS